MRVRVAGLLLIAPLVLCAKPAPNFRGNLTDGSQVMSSDLYGSGKSLLLSFWATWCAPCMEELKLLDQAFGSNSKLPVTFLTVNVDSPETSNDVRPTLRLYRFHFPVILDPKHTIFEKYTISRALPFTVLISPQGNIIESYNGFHDDMIEKLKEKLFRMRGEANVNLSRPSG